MTTTQPVLTGRQKAAIFCITIGAERSAKILKHMKSDEIEQLTIEIARLRQVRPEDRELVLGEFNELAMGAHFLNQGGLDYARDLLEKALGPSRAAEVLHRLTPSLERRPFEGVRKIDPAQLAGFIQTEHPQTVAVILAHLLPEQAAVVLSSLPPDRQSDVLRRVAKLDRTSPEMLREVERVLERKLSALVQHEHSAAGGIDWAASVLNRVDRTTEKTIMEDLASDTELVAEIKKRMFLFEDIVHLDDRSVQRILREVDMNKDMPLALKAANQDVWQKVLTNISQRAGETLKESVEYLGPVRIRDVEEAQSRVVEIIRRLEEMGEIVVMRGGASEFI